MLNLEQLKPSQWIEGIESAPVRIVAVEPMSTDSVSVIYKTSDGKPKERMLFRADEEKLRPAETHRPWALNGPAHEFKLALEAYRIQLAYLFDPMMAVYTSNVDPLPHQITAVYETMLNKQPLKFVLADDPGSGKTIMAGLFIRELIMRADARRILIVAPGKLGEQWQDELLEKFGLDFRILGREDAERSAHGNPFDDYDQIIARLDQVTRNENFQDMCGLSQKWDLIVVDEAHKLSASYYGREIKKTQRFELGEKLAKHTRHFLLMTATPHNGKEEDFQLFLSLLDPDRFQGKSKEKVDVKDIMRRMVKEELYKFDNTPLFPERRAYTVNYQLSELEQALYDAVTNYVRNEMNKADDLDGVRRNRIGFALTTLQRRLASSPEAIFQSIRNRRKRLTDRIEEARKLGLSALEPGTTYSSKLPTDMDEYAEEATGEEYEEVEDQITSQETAAKTIKELEAEIELLKALEKQAADVVASGKDRKWDEVSKIFDNLERTPEMVDGSGRIRKMIIFTEHKATLEYLTRRIGDRLGRPDAVVNIMGATIRKERLDIQERFRNHPEVRILVATDAAGEGVNLQNANLMINYDLPWNPNRLEQRFGRIHRIGQTEVCHLWNLVAGQTREGEVYLRLLSKLEIEAKALGGKVFNVLSSGVLFEERSLRDMLIEAIRYGERADVKARLSKQVDGAFDRQHIEGIWERNALYRDIMAPAKLLEVKEYMERAEARKLQPYFIRSFFQQAFKEFKGELKPREPGRSEITYVPGIIREWDATVQTQERTSRYSVQEKYERVCFEKSGVRCENKPQASLLHPGHPLMQAVTGLVLSQYKSLLKQGTLVLDPNDFGVIPRMLFVVDHAIKECDGTIASRRMQFVEIEKGGTARPVDPAVHLDYEPLKPEDQKLIADILTESWLTKDLETIAQHYASDNIVPEHYKEVSIRRESEITRTIEAVHTRLTREIKLLNDRYYKVSEEPATNPLRKANLETIRRDIDVMQSRLDARKKELECRREVSSDAPVIVGGALVIPIGLIAERRGDARFSEDPEARARIERIAMQAVMDAETAMGHKVDDISKKKLGWDITSQPPAGIDGELPLERHIEVKGRVKGSTTVTVTKKEIFYGFNQGDKFLLAIVLVDGDKYEGPFYIRKPFKQEPDWAVVSVNFELDELLKKSEKEDRHKLQ